MVQQQGLSIDLETRNGKLDLFSRPQKTNMNGDTQSRYLDTTKKSTGFRFTEIMNGFVAVGSNIDDFAVAEKRAKGASSRAQIYLSIEVHDVSGGKLSSVSHYEGWWDEPSRAWQCNQSCR